MPVYSPSMLARGFNCGPSMGEYRSITTGPIYLELQQSSDKGIFYHALIELWLKEVKKSSDFPIIIKSELKPSFKEFFDSGHQVRQKLAEVNITTSSQFTTVFDKFYDRCLIEHYFHEVAESKGINDLLIEEEWPKSGTHYLSKDQKLSLKGRPDCVIVTAEDFFVIDWKTNIDETMLNYYGIQMKLYQSLVNSTIRRPLHGRIISILQSEDEDMDWPFLKDSETLTTVTMPEIIESSLSTEKKSGEWCQNCKYNFKLADVCLERVNDAQIIEHTKRLLDKSFNPGSFIDVDFERDSLIKVGKSMWKYGTDDNQVFFKFKIDSLPGGGNIRCKGKITHHNNSDRIFHVHKSIIY